MNKKIIALLMIGMMFPIATALSEGQVLTRQQVNNFDLSSYDTINELVNLLECQKYSGFSYLWNHEWYYVKPFDCFQLDRITDDHYVIHRKTYFPRFKVSDYDFCMDSAGGYEEGEQICYDWVSGQMRSYGKNKIFKIKQEIINYQDEVDSGTSFGGTFGGDLF